jgi:hypothetical protein
MMPSAAVDRDAVSEPEIATWPTLGEVTEVVSTHGRWDVVAHVVDTGGDVRLTATERF